MFSSLKKLSLFAIIISICNIAFSAMLCLYVSMLESAIGFPVMFCIQTFLMTTSILLVIISIALINCHKDIEIQTEHDAKVTRDLKKRVETLERKMEL
jgi:hypothetical protein